MKTLTIHVPDNVDVTGLEELTLRDETAWGSIAPILKVLLELGAATVDPTSTSGPNVESEGGLP